MGARMTNPYGYQAQQGFPAHPGFVDPPRPASGGTAITAGVLAILGGLWALVSMIGGFAIASLDSSDLEYSTYNSADGYSSGTYTLPDWLGTYGIIIALVNLVVAVLLIVGAILLFTKKSAGRFMVAGGCGLVILIGVAGIIVGAVMSADIEGGMGGIAVGGVIGFIALVPAIATLVLALVPPTGRWCAQDKVQVGGYPPVSPPGGFPQAGQPGQPGNFGQPGGFGQQPPQQW
jgi:hypothetical protein